MPQDQLLRGLDCPAGDALSRATCEAMDRPLPDCPQGAARVNVSLTLGQHADGSFGLDSPPIVAVFYTPEDTDPPNGVAEARVDLAGSATWLQPPGVFLSGVVTIVGDQCHCHLLRGVTQLRAALAKELEAVFREHLAGIVSLDAMPALATAEEILAAAP